MKNLSKNTSQSSGGVGCLTVIGLIFVVLKLTGNLNWSWWWVLSPFIFQFAIIGLIFATFGAIMLFSRR